MAYATYTTEALVCGHRDSYTSDRSYLLFTKDAGMVWAGARSVREERSRQRYALQDFSLIRASLVRGKTGWKIGSVTVEQNVYHAAPDRAARGAVTQIVRLLRQFIHGETPHPHIFEDSIAAIGAVLRNPADATAWTDIFSLRLCQSLGYVATDRTYESFFAPTIWQKAPPPLPETARHAIEQARQASHL